MRAARAKLVAPRAQRTGQSTVDQTAARGEAPAAASEEPQTSMMDQDTEPSWADMISGPGGSGNLTPTKAAMEPTSPPLRDEAAQHLQHVVKLHVELRDAMATKTSGTKVRVSVQSKGRDHAALDGEEKEASEQSVTDIDTNSDSEADDALPPVAGDAIVPDVDPSIQARRDAARAEGRARVDARTAERVASLRGLPTKQQELQAPPLPRSRPTTLGPSRDLK